MRFVSLLLLLASCANVPSVPVCYELQPWQGYCVDTVTQKSQYVDDAILLDGKTWWELRPSMVMVPMESWRELKEYVIKNCKLTGKCPEIERFSSQLDQNE